MPTDQPVKNWFKSDKVFNALYPLHIQEVAEKHWTPIAVAEKAAAFLAISADVKILDIGSGSGKFCLTAAHLYPQTLFYGIEQRPGLVSLSQELAKKLELENVVFLCNNITKVDFSRYDHFYFYNSFYENVDPAGRIDDTMELSEGLYDYYTQYLHTALGAKPAGTRLVTFHSLEDEITADYRLADVSYDTLLKMWIKA